MTNAKFYKDKLEDGYASHADFCQSVIIPYVLNPLGKECDGELINCTQCQVLTAAWLQEEHKDPEIDWSNIPVDTPILVKNEGQEIWKKRYFARFVSGKVSVWDQGCTSFTNLYGTSFWDYAKLWEGSEEQAAEKEAQCTD